MKFFYEVKPHEEDTKNNMVSDILKSAILGYEGFKYLKKRQESVQKKLPGGGMNCCIMVRTEW